MAKPVTKGAQIAVRLPLELDAVVRERAEAHGETAAAYLERQIQRLVPPGSKPTISTGATVPSLPPVPSGGCDHRSSRVDDALGKRVCKRCREILAS